MKESPVNEFILVKSNEKARVIISSEYEPPPQQSLREHDSALVYTSYV